MTPHARLGALALVLIAAAAGILGWQVYSGRTPIESPSLDHARELFDTIAEQREVLTPSPLRRSLTGRGAELTVNGVLRETNRHRAEAGLPPLTLNPLLSQAAAAKVADMFAQQYFEHESPNGLGPADLVDATGYDFIRVGENLALGNFASDADLVQAWMDSPGHRANILHPGFTEIGLSAHPGLFEDHRTWLAVQEFALPVSACPGVDTTLRRSIDEQRAALEASSTSLDTQLAELNREQEALTALVVEINRLRQQAAELIEAGNRNIEEGNRIYEETGDRDQAQPYWDKGEQQHAEGQALLEQADTRQAEYESRRQVFETNRTAYNNRVAAQRTSQQELEQLINRLNQQINAFNSCLESTAAN